MSALAIKIYIDTRSHTSVLHVRDYVRRGNTRNSWTRIYGGTCKFIMSSKKQDTHLLSRSEREVFGKLAALQHDEGDATNALITELRSLKTTRKHPRWFRNQDEIDRCK